MQNLPSKIALITGASGGIGSAVAREFVKMDMTVIGAARNMDKLKAIEHDMKSVGRGLFVPYQIDVTDYNKVNEMFAFIKSKHRGVDVCVNSAGDILQTSLLDGKADEWNRLMNVHLISRLITCQLTVKSIQERNLNEGHLFNVSSFASRKVFKESFTHFYSCTKFALHAACEGLRQELKVQKSHIKVTEIVPGLTKTAMIERMPCDPLPGNSEEIMAIHSQDVATVIVQALALPARAEVNQIFIGPTIDIPI